MKRMQNRRETIGTSNSQAEIFPYYSPLTMKLSTLVTAFPSPPT